MELIVTDVDPGLAGRGRQVGGRCRFRCHRRGSRPKPCCCRNAIGQAVITGPYVFTIMRAASHLRRRSVGGDPRRATRRRYAALRLGWRGPTITRIGAVRGLRDLAASLDDPDGPAATEVAQWRERLYRCRRSSTCPPIDHGPPIRGGRGAGSDFRIDDGLWSRVADFAAHRGSPPFMVTHTALAVLLSRIGDNRDVVIGTHIAGRDQSRLDAVVGMFVNMLALRTVIDPRRPENRRSPRRGPPLCVASPIRRSRSTGS